jgi:hypothetical protein
MYGAYISSTIYRLYIINYISTIYHRLYIDYISSTIYHRLYIIDYISSTIYHRLHIIDYISSTIYRLYIIDYISSTIYHRLLDWPLWGLEDTFPKHKIFVFLKVLLYHCRYMYCLVILLHIDPSFKIKVWLKMFQVLDFNDASNL